MDVQEGGLLDEGPWVTAQEAADYLKISLKTLARLHDADDGPPRYLAESWYRYAPAEIDAWLLGRRDAGRSAGLEEERVQAEPASDLEVCEEEAKFLREAVDDAIRLLSTVVDGLRAAREGQPLTSWRLARVYAVADMHSVEGRARAANAAVAVIAEHPDPLVRDQYMLDVASRCRANVDRIRDALEKVSGSPRGKRS